MATQTRNHAPANALESSEPYPQPTALGAQWDPSTSVPRPHVVILGAGFGGLAAAKSLADAPVRVTVVDRQNHHLFQPLLYQVATAALSPSDVASPIRWVLRRQANTRVLLATAESVDVRGHVVHASADGQRLSLPYDYLIVATGATHAYFGHDEWQESAPGLKTLADALRIRRHVLLMYEQAERVVDRPKQQKLLTFLVVGGGPTGVELAGALAEISRHTLTHDFRSVDPAAARIVLVEAAPTILPALPPPLQRAGERSLRRLGVEVRTGSPVRAIGPDWVDIGSDRINTATILWAAGVAASGLGRTLGVPLDRAGRVRVTSELTVPGHPRVFVIGDLAHFSCASGKPLPGVAHVAIQQGRHAASNIRRTLSGQSPLPFRHRHMGNLATIGRGAAVADFGWITASGKVAWAAWLLVHLWHLIGFRNRFSVMAQWAWSYFTYQRNARLITDCHHEVNPPLLPRTMEHARVQKADRRRSPVEVVN